jgi:hypothetical protein
MSSTRLLASAAPWPGRTRAWPRRSLVAALLIALAPAAPAATISVTTPDDASGPDDAATCTLRQAIASMNAAALRGGCAHAAPGVAFGSDDTITFAPSSITGAAVPGTVTLQDPGDGGTSGGTLLITANRLLVDGSEWRQSPYGGVTIARPENSTQAFRIVCDTAGAGGSLTLNGLILRNGRATGSSCGKAADGGGLSIPSADLSLIASTISGNSADNLGGGIHSQSGTVTVTDSIVSGNSAYRGGGIHVGSGSLTLAGSTLADNYALRGGGIAGDSATLDLAGSTISDNSARRGGGAFFESGMQTLTGSRIEGNWAYYDGGGIYAANGTLTVSGSTIDGNGARYSGGGIHALSGTLDLDNSTISGNSVYRTGGGILCHGELALVHATVSQNGAGQTGGGIDGSGHGRIEGSIVAGNTQASGSDVNLGGPWSGDHNLLDAALLDLGPLQDNGGPTPTMLPGAGSAAIDAIAAADCGTAVDQRGVTRPQGAGCDIGAVEVVADAIFADGFDPPSEAGSRRPSNPPLVKE